MALGFDSEHYDDTPVRPLMIFVVQGFIALLLAPSLCFSQGQHGNANVSSDLAAMVTANTGNSIALIDVLVQFASPPSKGLLDAINAVAAGHGPRAADLSVIQAYMYSLPAAAIANLAANPNIAYISPDRAVR